MRYLIALCMSLLVALNATAETTRQKQFGDVTVHYNVFNSTFLQPNVAMGVGLVRDHQLAVLNIAAMKDGQPLEHAMVTGKVRDLMGRSQELEFHRVSENTGGREAEYFLTEFEVKVQEVLQFEIEVRTPREHYELQFNQEVFPEEK